MFSFAKLKKQVRKEQHKAERDNVYKADSKRDTKQTTPLKEKTSIQPHPFLINLFECCLSHIKVPYCSEQFQSLQDDLSGIVNAGFPKFVEEETLSAQTTTTNLRWLFSQIYNANKKL